MTLVIHQIENGHARRPPSPPLGPASPAGRTAVGTLSWGDSLHERLLEQRIIVLGQQVDDGIDNRLCAQLLLLAADDPAADIALYVNSPGGSITAGMAIYDTMNFVPCDVAT